VKSINVPYEVVDRRSGDIAFCYADASNAERELGWKSKLLILLMCAELHGGLRLIIEPTK